MTPGAADILAARERIRPHIRSTPLYHSAWLSDSVGTRVSLKFETLQPTGSFKIRGALNALVRLPAAAAVVTASAGNHGLAIARAAQTLGMRAQVFVPHSAPEAKVAGIRACGASLHDSAADYDEAERRAILFARESGAFYVSPYNHPDVIAGAGTVALEIMEAAPDVDVIAVSLGGGGLASGAALASRDRGVAVAGVEADASPVFRTSLAAGAITTIDPQPTLADGLSGNLEPGAITFSLVRRLVRDVAGVSEDDIAAAIRGLAEREHVIAEGAGAVAVAGVLAGKMPAARHIAVVVSGGNIDLASLISTTTRQGRQAPPG